MEDYIILRDYDTDGGWCEIFLFDHTITNGDIERIENAIDKIKSEQPDEYSNEDVEEAINTIVPYTKSIIFSDTDQYHTIYY